MQFRQLGSLTVPVIGMGSASSSGFNVESPEGLENCRRILDNCLAAGTTFLDTSPMYRRAEGVIGAGIRGRRHEFQLATKVYCSGVETGRAQIQLSFDLLGTDHIEVFQIHNLVDWRTHLPYLEGLKAQGRIDVIGITHYQPPFYEELAQIMRTGRVDAIQIPYSLLEREAEEELLPLAAEMDIGVIVMRPLVKGNGGDGTEASARPDTPAGVRHRDVGTSGPGLDSGRPASVGVDSSHQPARAYAGERCCRFRNAAAGTPRLRRARMGALYLV